jgi:muconolactone delta-isomerase
MHGTLQQENCIVSRQAGTPHRQGRYWQQQLLFRHLNGRCFLIKRAFNLRLLLVRIKQMSAKRLTKQRILAVAFLFFFLSTTTLVWAQGSANSSGSPSQAEVDRIIKAFSAKEGQFRHALNEYSFKRDAVLQSLGMGGQITGEYHRVSTFTFDDQGNRYEKISYFPMPSFQGITQEDIDDLGGIQPFALEPSKVAEYDFKYVGKEKIDELNLYVFDVTPKVMPNPKKTKERLFSGRIWVDDQDLQIVKTKGKGVPETKSNKFPIVETYREQIDGRYWFPTYSYADEELIFDKGEPLHIRMKVRYSDFELARAKVKIIEVDDPDAPKKQTKPPATSPRKP